MRNKSFKRLHARILTGCVVFLFILLAASLSWASIVYETSGVSFPGTISATVTMEYTPLDKKLEFWVDNTSSVESYITGFAFNVPSAVTGIIDPVGFIATKDDGAVDIEGDPPEWSALVIIDGVNEKMDGINTPGPFGFFDMAAVTGKSKNLGGGKIANGIAPDMGAFYFAFILTGQNPNDTSDIEALITGDFDILSDLGNGNGIAQPIVVRFQSLPNDESDVSVVPIPSAILLLGSGLLSLVGIRKKFIS